VDVFYLEYDTQRAGTFEPLKYLPPHKSVVLGVISSKLPALEHIENVKRRIHEAAETIAQGEPKRSKEAALNQWVCFVWEPGRLLTDWVGSASAHSADSRATPRATASVCRMWSASCSTLLRSRRRSGSDVYPAPSRS
jgi:hypothetical protein